MNIRYFLGSNKSIYLLCCNSKEYFFSVFKPWIAFLKNIQYNICIKQYFHAS